MRARAEIVDDAFERLNLRRSARRSPRGSCRSRPAAGSSARASCVDLGPGAPLGAEAHQDRQRQDAEHDGQRRTQADRDPADDAARAVSNQHRVTSGAHSSSYCLSVDRAS